MYWNSFGRNLPQPTGSQSRKSMLVISIDVYCRYGQFKRTPGYNYMYLIRIYDDTESTTIAVNHPDIFVWQGSINH